VTQGSRSVALLGAPSNSGANAPGLERAPTHLRRCGLLAELSERGLLASDAGDTVSRRYRADRQNPAARNLGAVVDSARDADGAFGRQLVRALGDALSGWSANRLEVFPQILDPR
jgi:arginase family enzyme